MTRSVNLSSKKWLLAFTICIFLTAAVVAALNWVTDPFGVFGDKNLNWYSFNFTNNPAPLKLPTSISTRMNLIPISSAVLLPVPFRSSG